MRKMIYNLALGKAIQIYREGKAGVQIDGHKAIEYLEEIIDLQSDLDEEYLEPVFIND